MSDQEHEIKVHHYRRSDARSAGKELVTEIVVASSDTGRFLRKMESTRLTRPCFQSLDMRGRVLGDCTRYVINDRVHYLDDISYAMFKKGLADNHGIYTVGTFESIIFGEHTIARIQEAEEAARKSIREQKQVREQRYGQESRPATSEVPGRATTVTLYNPDVLPFGYYRRRQEGRLQYATGVRLKGKAGTVKGSSRDISAGGVQVVVKGLCPFELEQLLEATFTGLETQAGAAKVTGVRYTVVALTRREGEVVMGLQRQDRKLPHGFTDFIDDMVERFQRKYKLDVEDDYLSVMTLFYERCYTESLTQIPVFIHQVDGVPVLQTVALTDGNLPMMQYFSNETDHYDFSLLQLAHRLEALAEQGTLLLALYRATEGGEHYRIHSAAGSEYNDSADFDRFVRHAMSFPEHMVVRVQVENVQARVLDEDKAEYFLERLSYKSAADALGLRKRLDSLLSCGVLMDVTRQIRDGMMAGEVAGTDVDPEGLHCWIGDSRCVLGADGTAQRVSETKEQGARSVDVVRFGYVERRREDRYLVETAVQLALGKVQLQGVTQDISTRGMRVLLPPGQVLEMGQEVTVGLVSLQKKKSSTNLMNIPYRVVELPQGKGNSVRLERMIGRSQEGLSKFFVELITKNQQKLSIDAGDIWSATASRIYEALHALNTGSLPFFIGRNEAGIIVVQRVAVAETPNRLARFFQDPGGDFEFYPMGDPRLVLALNDAITAIQRQSGTQNGRAPHCELEMYFYKEHDDASDDWVLRWSSELELAEETEKQAYIEKAMTHDDFCFVKIAATYITQPSPKYLDKLIEPIRTQSRHRSTKLLEQLRSVTGYGEMIDITADVVRSRPVIAPES